MNREEEHEEMVVGGFIVTGVLLIVALGIIAVQSIWGWLN